MKTVVVIGAGFCGAVAAAQLLRAPASGPLRVILINRSGLMARGVAYGTRTDAHALNVPAGRMGAYPEDEAGFLKFAQRHDPRIGGATFVSRRLYGDYLESLLTDAVRGAPAGVSFRAMVGEVRRIEPDEHGRGARVVLAGDTLQADRVVLALGNFEPADPRVTPEHRGFYRSPRYVRDPWRPDALWVVKPDEPVLVIGSGLTMLDIVLSLRARGHVGVVHALSRRGLLPLPHRELETPPAYRTDLPQRLPQFPNVRAWLRAVREEVAAAAAQGVDWRDIIGGLRSATPALWRLLPQRERARFLRHLRPYWDVHRHRYAPALGSSIEGERARGSLRMIAGRLLGFEESTDGVDVLLRRRGAAPERLRVGYVINCTGPEGDTRSLREPLIAQLRDSGLVVPDALGQGLEVADDYALVGRDGRPSSVLYYVGPFLKARDWEATAVPELRVHVARLADHLRRSLAG